MSTTARELFYGAYRRAGMVFLERTGLSPDQEEEARQTYNTMVDAWRVDGHTVRHKSRNVFNIVANDGDYTVGPGGNFDIPYQEELDKVGLILSGQSGHPEYQMEEMTEDEYRSWVLKETKTNIPRRYWYEKSFPLAIIHILYIPSEANQIALYIDNPIGEIAVASGSPPNYAGVTLYYPPGYQRAIEFNLAMEIWQKDSARSTLNPGAIRELKDEARASFKVISGSNSRPEIRTTDLSGTRATRTNIYNGNRWGR